MLNVTDSPSSNTGVTLVFENPLQPLTTKALSGVGQKTILEQKYELNKPKLDWYAGTIKGKIKGLKPDSFGRAKVTYFDLDIDDMVSHCSDYLKSIGLDNFDIWDTKIRGNYLNSKKLFICRNYGYSVHFILDNETILSLSYGGSNGKHGVYLAITGHNCNQIYTGLKSSLPDNMFIASRVDAAYDAKADYLEIKRRIKKVCKNQNFSFQTTGGGFDKNGDKLGETIYINITKHKKIRIYEKGFERIAAGVDAPTDWVRFEIEVHGDIANNHESKNILSDLSAEEILTMDKKITTLFNTFTGLSVPSSDIVLNRKKESTHERAVHALMKQYAPTLKALLNDEKAFMLFLNDLYGDLSTSDDVPPWVQKKALLMGFYGSDNPLTGLIK